MAEHRDDDAGSLQPTFDFASLRRWPDVEADNLFAHDAADKLLLDTAQPLLDGLEGDRIAVVNDHYGALTLALAAAGPAGSPGGAGRPQLGACAGQ